jgi:hypothetical protein
MTSTTVIMSIVPTGEFSDYRPWKGPYVATYTVDAVVTDTAYLPHGATKRTKPRLVVFPQTMIVDADAGWLRNAITQLFAYIAMKEQS